MGFESSLGLSRYGGEIKLKLYFLEVTGQWLQWDSVLLALWLAALCSATVVSRALFQMRVVVRV